MNASLADLRMINRWFGGTGAARKLMRRVVEVTGSRKLRWLDVAAASGDIARSLTRSFAEDGIELQTVMLDRVLEHLRANREDPPFRQTTAKGWGTQQLEVRPHGVQGDALALPFADGAFDVVGSSLLVHELEPDEVQKFMREALRVARVAVVINDLRRSWAHLALIYAGMPLFSRITRHDAPASVKKAYTPAELAEMVGDHRYELKRYYLCRMGMIVWKELCSNKHPEEVAAATDEGALPDREALR